MIDLASLRDVPGLKTAIEAHAAAEHALLLDPNLSVPNASSFIATFVLLAWAKAGGDNAALLRALERIAIRSVETEV